MIRPDYYLFGYVVFTVSEDDVGRAAEIFLKKGINAKFSDNKIIVGRRKVHEVESAMATRVKFSRSEMLGFWGFLIRNRKRYGLFLAVLCTVSLFFATTDMVWDVRIEGCGAVTAEKIERELSACGFGVGARWSRTDTAEVETELLAASSVVGWVNINRRGTVAYVTVSEKESVKEEQEHVGYSNIVAARDGVIEEITVMRGIAAVKVGDTVKAGDLLISGIIPTELGGGYCYAEGTVIARVSDSVTAVAEHSRDEKKVKKVALSRAKFKIFGFSVNIFKSYRNLPSDYDIIEGKKNFRLFGKELPMSFFGEYVSSYDTERVFLTAEEMTALASERLTSALAERLLGATLVRIRTEGTFSDDSYSMTATFVCTEQIGRDSPFSVKEN